LNQSKSKFLTQIISIDGEVRSRSLLIALKFQNIEFQISTGIVVSEQDFLSQKFHIAKIAEKICLRPISKGELGCALAHRLACENLILSDKEFGIVFEDDAIINNEINFELIERVLNTSEPRLLAIGWTPGYGVSANSNQKLPDNIFRAAIPTTGAYGYAINKAAAKILGGGPQKVIDLPDYPINSFLKIRFFLIEPTIVSTNFDEKSSQIGKRFDQLENTRKINHAIKLFSAMIYLVFQAATRKVEISFRQIFLRMVLRDQLFNYAQRSLVSNKASSVSSQLVHAPKNLTKFLSFFRLI